MNEAGVGKGIGKLKKTELNCFTTKKIFSGNPPTPPPENSSAESKIREVSIIIKRLSPSDYYMYRQFNPLQPSGHYMYHQFNIQQFYVLPTQCIYVFCVDV